MIKKQPDNSSCLASGSKFISNAYPARDTVSFTSFTESKSITQGMKDSFLLRVKYYAEKEVFNGTDDMFQKLFP